MGWIWVGRFGAGAPVRLRCILSLVPRSGSARRMIAPAGVAAAVVDLAAAAVVVVVVVVVAAAGVLSSFTPPQLDAVRAKFEPMVL